VRVDAPVLSFSRCLWWFRIESFGFVLIFVRPLICYSGECHVSVRRIDDLVVVIVDFAQIPL